MFSRMRARWHLVLGKFLARLGWYRLAAKQFQSAIGIFPRHLIAHCLLGWTYQALRQHEKALAAFDQAHQIAPNSPYAHAHKARSWMQFGKYQQAADALNRAFRIDPKYANDPLKVEALAQCYCHLGQIEKAHDTYLAAERLNPNNAELVFRVGWALRKLERYQEAETQLKRAGIAQP
jgi:tetratricopeptide (TPR) repeat protein